MAKQFEFDEFEGGGKVSPAHCARCEEMLTDAVDEGLDEADRAWFDEHVRTCPACSQRLAEAQRGAAWLEMLKTPRPEPSGRLMERILAQTAGGGYEQPQLIPVSAARTAPIATPGNLLPFRPATPMAAAWAWRKSALFEPRLAMTAAMAFFSIALTLNLTGVELNRLHLSSLRPSSLKHTYYAANAGAARYYDNLRVVRVLESRVEDLRAASADVLGTGNGAARPENRPEAKPTAPKVKPEDRKKPESGPGMSRREPPARPRTRPSGGTMPDAEPVADFRRVPSEGGRG